MSNSIEKEILIVRISPTLNVNISYVKRLYPDRVYDNGNHSWIGNKTQVMVYFYHGYVFRNFDDIKRIKKTVVHK